MGQVKLILREDVPKLGDAGDVLADSAAQATAGISDVIPSDDTLTLVIEGAREVELEAKA